MERLGWEDDEEQKQEEEEAGGGEEEEGTFASHRLLNFSLDCKVLRLFQFWNCNTEIGPSVLPSHPGANSGTRGCCFLDPAPHTLSGFLSRQCPGHFLWASWPLQGCQDAVRLHDNKVCEWGDTANEWCHPKKPTSPTPTLLGPWPQEVEFFWERGWRCWWPGSCPSPGERWCKRSPASRQAVPKDLARSTMSCSFPATAPSFLFGVNSFWVVSHPKIQCRWGQCVFPQTKSPRIFPDWARRNLNIPVWPWLGQYGRRPERILSLGTAQVAWETSVSRCQGNRPKSRGKRVSGSGVCEPPFWVRSGPAMVGLHRPLLGMKRIALKFSGSSETFREGWEGGQGLECYIKNTSGNWGSQRAKMWP